MHPKFYLLSLLFLTSFVVNAQEKTSEPEEGWKRSGKGTLLVNQAAFSDWASGGVNSVSLSLNVDYDLNYFENGWSWDTKFIGSYGLSYIEGDTFLKKTNDRIEINSLLGKQFSERWSYSTLFNFKSQFARGYRFGENDEGKETRSLRTHFFSPAYIQFGIGFYWKKSNDLWLNIAPFSQRITMVSRRFTRDLDPGKEYFGVGQGDNHLFELGASVAAFYKFKAMENITLENRLGLYSDYLGDPQNIDFDYTVSAHMQINKYISTNLELQLVYDDNAIGRLQVREVFGIGVNLDL